MAFFLVNQGQTYRFERSGSYIWSPKLNKAGHQNKGYTLMKSVRKGDYIIHNSGGQLSAISIVKEDCKSGIQPQELKHGQKEYDWNDDGWVVYTNYYDFDVPIRTADLVDWMKDNYNSDSAFQIDGKLRLQYLCNLHNSHAEYLLKKAISLQSDEKVMNVLLTALEELNPENRSDEVIANVMSLSALKTIAAQRSKNKVTQKEIVTTQYYRDAYVTELAKRLANGKCNLCHQPAPFKDSKGKPYLETHHIIWLSQGGSDSLDNTVALCPNCHRKMHIVADPQDIERLKSIAQKNIN